MVEVPLSHSESRVVESFRAYVRTVVSRVVEELERRRRPCPRIVKRILSRKFYSTPYFAIVTVAAISDSRRPANPSQTSLRVASLRCCARGEEDDFKMIGAKMIGAVLDLSDKLVLSISLVSSEGCHKGDRPSLQSECA